MKRVFILLISIVFLSFAEYFAQNYSIKMNEIYSRGTSENPDWIELYNTSSSSVDISSYKIYDSAGKAGTKNKKGFTSGTAIPAYGFYVVTTDGSDAADFGLSNSGEEVWLEDESGNVIEDIVFPALESGQSYGRVPDGTGSWSVLTTQTKGAANETATSVEKESVITKDYTLNQNYPNPFNPSTIISFTLAKQGRISLEVMNILGQNIQTLVQGEYSAGSYKTVWNARNISAGIYFCRLKVISEDGISSSTIRKMQLIK